MTSIETQFVHYWTKKRKSDDWQTWGEMLGIYWTSDKFSSTDQGKQGNQTTKRRKVLLPLAGILAPDVLHKTLDRVLDKTPESKTPGSPGATDLAKTIDGHYSLDSLPLDKYKELFNFATEEVSKPQTPEQTVKAPVPTDGLVLTDAFKSPKLDLDHIRRVDPELAKHLDPECQW